MSIPARSSYCISTLELSCIPVFHYTETERSCPRYNTPWGKKCHSQSAFLCDRYDSRPHRWTRSARENENLPVKPETGPLSPPEQGRIPPSAYQSLHYLLLPASWKENPDSNNHPDQEMQSILRLPQRFHGFLLRTLRRFLSDE